MKINVVRPFQRLLIVLSLSLVVCGCNLRDPLPIPIEDITCHQVKVGPGPEDFVLDKWSYPHRLLISSHDRRHPETAGNIYWFDIATEKNGIMSRIGEPEKIAVFKPHGMDILWKGGQTLLYVIIHDPYGHMERDENAIAVYEMTPDILRFRQLLEDPKHLWSPNDLSVLPSGDFYVTNDAPSTLAMYTRSSSSEITYFDHRTGTFKTVADDIAFANGICAEKDRVYVSATLGDQVMVFPRSENGDLGKPEPVVHLKGPDNLTRYRDSLLVTAHYDDLAFLSHKRSSDNIAPSVVFQIHPEMYTKDTVFVDNGHMISAASTAMVVNNKIYISQVFDPYIVVCNLPAFMR